MKKLIKVLIGNNMWLKLRSLKRVLYYLKDRCNGNAGLIKTFYESCVVSAIYSMENKHVFFGYYDIQQMDVDEKRLLVHVVKKDAQTAGDDIEIGYYSIENNQYTTVAKSRAWSWQQGSRLRWNPKNKNQILFNNCVNGRYVCDIWDVSNKKKVDEIPMALYDIDSNLHYGFGVNFSRLQRLRPGYGYNTLDDETVGQCIPQNDGIFRYNFDTKQIDLIISYNRLCKDFDEKQYEHYINHISISPDGNRFIFFHVWSLGDVNKWKLRLYVSDVEGKDLKILEENDTISHYTWKDNSTLLTTKINENSNDTCYYEYDVETGKKTAILSPNLNLDGHPSFLKDNTVFISDTYPQPDNLQHLFKFDKNCNQYIPIIDIYHDPRLYSEKRCDLHPRLSRSNKYISIDSTYKGNTRSVVLIKKL